MIYFNEALQAHAFEIEDPVATVDDSVWEVYCTEPRGVAWDIKEGEFVTMQTVDFLKARAEAKAQIRELKEDLASTDYMSLKYSEGALSSEDWAPIRDQRSAWRAEINRLESEFGLSQ